jgi:hypothetical protein
MSEEREEGFGVELEQVVVDLDGADEPSSTVSVTVEVHSSLSSNGVAELPVTKTPVVS